MLDHASMQFAHMSMQGDVRHVPMMNQIISNRKELLVFRYRSVASMRSPIFPSTREKGTSNDLPSKVSVRRRKIEANIHESMISEKRTAR